MHGIFLHYFKGNGHIDCQGALSERDFRMLLDQIRKHHRLVDADRFCEEYDHGMRDANTVCLCFSCGLKSQYDIALPILEEQGIKAFWMLYSQMLTGTDVLIEVYHHFRFCCFDNIDRFYDAFFDAVQDNLGLSSAGFQALVNDFEKSGYLSWAKYYTDCDRFFKYLRDSVLADSYDVIMRSMMESRNYSPADHRNQLWIREREIKYLSDTGHMIGLHTHTHPNCVGMLSYEDQHFEYSTNKHILENIIGREIRAMSHPCNSYNRDTLRVLKELGIRYGFCSGMASKGRGALEIPTEDHSNLMRKWNIYENNC